MNEILRQNLEALLSGDLTETERTRLEQHFNSSATDREEFEAFRETSLLLRELRPQDGEEWEPDTGFYARVSQRIDRERTVPFWQVFLEPMIARRLAFAGLMWLLLLGTYTVAYNGVSLESNPHTVEAMLMSRPSNYDVRLGADLERNRNSMLAVVMRAGD
jgi:anti-sigma factor RsiW